MKDFMGQDVDRGDRVVFVQPAPLRSLTTGIVHHVTDKSIIVTYIPYYSRVSGNTQELTRSPNMVVKITHETED